MQILGKNHTFTTKGLFARQSKRVRPAERQDIHWEAVHGQVVFVPVLFRRHRSTPRVHSHLPFASVFLKVFGNKNCSLFF